MSAAIHIVMEQPPGPDSQFVDVETDDGRSIRAGVWSQRPDGFWSLRITVADLAVATIDGDAR